MKHIDNIKLTIKSTIKEALTIIDSGAIKIAVVIDVHEKLIGTLSDGDIRRGILDGKTLDSVIEDIYFKTPTVINVNKSKEDVIKLCIAKKIYQIPVIDDLGRIIGIELLDELLKPKVRPNKVVLMVGGLGARLKPLTETTPITTATASPNETFQSPAKGNDLVEFICVYLICDAPDLENITPVADCLFDLGYEVILPAFEGDEAEVREDHEDNLCRADAVLIYYATANELWLHRKLREVRKSAGLGRTEALKANGILVSPPNSQGKKWLRSHEAIVIHQPDDFSSELLAPFLTELKH